MGQFDACLVRVTAAYGEIHSMTPVTTRPAPNTTGNHQSRRRISLPIGNRDTNGVRSVTAKMMPSAMCTRKRSFR